MKLLRRKELINLQEYPRGGIPGIVSFYRAAASGLVVMPQTNLTGLPT